jgi:hypothetical protein
MIFQKHIYWKNWVDVKVEICNILGIIVHMGFYSNELHHQTKPHLVGPHRTKSEPIKDVYVPQV